MLDIRKPKSTSREIIFFHFSFKEWMETAHLIIPNWMFTIKEEIHLTHKSVCDEYYYDSYRRYDDYYFNEYDYRTHSEKPVAIGRRILNILYRFLYIISGPKCPIIPLAGKFERFMDANITLSPTSNKPSKY